VKRFILAAVCLTASGCTLLTNEPTPTELSRHETKPTITNNPEKDWAAALAKFDFYAAMKAGQRWSQQDPHSAAAKLALVQASNGVADLNNNDDEALEQLETNIKTLEQLEKQTQNQTPLQMNQAMLHYLWAEAIGLRVRLQGATGAIHLHDLAAHAEHAYHFNRDYDEGAPQRLLGLVLVKAPGWPNGPGDSDRGLELLKDVVARFPTRAENHLYLADALLDFSRIQDAQTAYARGRVLNSNNPRVKKLVLALEHRLHLNRSVKRY